MRTHFAYYRDNMGRIAATLCLGVWDNRVFYGIAVADPRAGGGRKKDGRRLAEARMLAVALGLTPVEYLSGERLAPYFDFSANATATVRRTIKEFVRYGVLVGRVGVFDYQDMRRAAKKLGLEYARR